MGVGIVHSRSREGGDLEAPLPDRNAFVRDISKPRTARTANAAIYKHRPETQCPCEKQLTPPGALLTFLGPVG